MSDTVLGFFIFLGLVAVAGAAAIVKERFWPTAAKGHRQSTDFGNCSNVDSLDMERRYIAQDAAISADASINGHDA